MKAKLKRISDFRLFLYFNRTNEAITITCPFNLLNLGRETLIISPIFINEAENLNSTLSFYLKVAKSVQIRNQIFF